MNKNPQIAVLEANRVMRSPEEIVAFEQALTELAQSPESINLEDLHLVLDDACEQPKVMFGLVHFLESFALQEQLQAFIQVLPCLVHQASEWTEILYTKILNDAEARIVFEEILRSMSHQQREEISRLLPTASAKQSSEQKTKVA